MMESPLVAGLVAGLCIFSGVTCLYFAWQRSGPQRLFTLAGWGLLVASVWSWSGAYSLEFGICFSVILTALVAWLVVILGGALPRRRDLLSQRPARARRSEPTVAGRVRWRRSIRFLAALVLPLTCAVVFALSFFGWSDAEESTRLVSAVFVGLLAWKAGVVWVSADRNLARAVLGLLLVNAGSGLLLAVQ
ncbi:hypothetical protein [Microbulbifer sp. YPW16]|uniref:hypothetical protein n=1 Tax=Microbulbifer sp. YPW16 TaxID=2904242 RepID=UPI001E337C81|nr:hypothetical protein [Microbulbifer sp. YPW16]UHQ55207.1 hypothetical protein LVE68_17115 [Microbulbifer sp. YPW16]